MVCCLAYIYICSFIQLDVALVHVALVHSVGCCPRVCSQQSWHTTLPHHPGNMGCHIWGNTGLNTKQANWPTNQTSKHEVHQQSRYKSTHFTSMVHFNRPCQKQPALVAHIAGRLLWEGIPPMRTPRKENSALEAEGCHVIHSSAGDGMECQMLMAFTTLSLDSMTLA